MGRRTSGASTRSRIFQGRSRHKGVGLLDEKIALVTGGSRGIGRAIALRLAHEGAHVMISFRSATPEAQKVVEAIRAGGRTSGSYQSDAGSFQGSKEIVEAIVKEFKRLDI